jgi:hypothetical protein
VDWHCNLVNKLSTQALNSAFRREIVGVTCNRHSLKNRANERRNGLTRLQCVAATSKTLRDLKTNMTGANPNMLRITNTKIDMPDIYPVGSQDTKMEIGNESARWFTWHNSDEPQRDLSK